MVVCAVRLAGVLFWFGRAFLVCFPRVMHNPFAWQCQFFPKASPMLGFSFSLLEGGWSEIGQVLLQCRTCVDWALRALLYTLAKVSEHGWLHCT